MASPLGRGSVNSAWHGSCRVRDRRPATVKGELTENVGTRVDSYSTRQPLGVVAGITPFNFPAMVPM